MVLAVMLASLGLVACSSQRSAGSPYVNPQYVNNLQPDCSCYSDADHMSTCCRSGVRYVCMCNSQPSCMLQQVGHC